MHKEPGGLQFLPSPCPGAAAFPGCCGDPGAALTQDVALAEGAGLLQEQPGVHAVPVELMRAGQHPQPLWGKAET